MSTQDVLQKLREHPFFKNNPFIFNMFNHKTVSASTTTTLAPHTTNVTILNSTSMDDTLALDDLHELTDIDGAEDSFDGDVDLESNTVANDANDAEEIDEDLDELQDEEEDDDGVNEKFDDDMSD